MNGEALKIILSGLLLTICCVALGWEEIVNYPEWFKRDRRADELLRCVLSSDQYSQLKRKGYIDIPSPQVPQRTYRVPQAPGLVLVIEKGQQTARLCLQPLERVPDVDIVVMHKLMIEADEETYLQTANKLTPVSSWGWDD